MPKYPCRKHCVRKQALTVSPHPSSSWMSISHSSNEQGGGEGAVPPESDLGAGLRQYESMIEIDTCGIGALVHGLPATAGWMALAGPSSKAFVIFKICFSSEIAVRSISLRCRGSIRACASKSRRHAERCGCKVESGSWCGRNECRTIYSLNSNRAGNSAISWHRRNPRMLLYRS